ncbi:transposase [Sulfobacillus thermosulfidooxidans]|uniref:transposase n=1 Tax=Sulfobacillus thermosulfidooxidans TaxID=28034 RepID=UPI001FA8B64A|nr:transposase [Sulfobacillus thermosulfidooxidans]
MGQPLVFQHPSIESLRRELARNAQLRMLCGFRNAAVPPASAYTRFLHRLMAEQDTVDGMFEQLVDDLAAVLPNFGQRLAMDSKGISSRAVRPAKNPTADGRRDVDADLDGRNTAVCMRTGLPGPKWSSGSGISCTWWWIRRTNCRWRGR